MATVFRLWEFNSETGRVGVGQLLMVDLGTLTNIFKQHMVGTTEMLTLELRFYVQGMTLTNLEHY